jgi:hypothetical protein
LVAQPARAQGRPWVMLLAIIVSNRGGGATLRSTAPSPFVTHRGRGRHHDYLKAFFLIHFEKRSNTPNSNMYFHKYISKTNPIDKKVRAHALNSKINFTMTIFASVVFLEVFS